MTRADALALMKGNIPHPVINGVQIKWNLKVNRLPDDMPYGKSLEDILKEAGETFKPSCSDGECGVVRHVDDK